MQRTIVLLVNHMQQHEESRNILRNNAGQCHAVFRHAADNDKKDVQNHVEHARDDEIEQRARRIAVGAEHRIA